MRKLIGLCLVGALAASVALIAPVQAAKKAKTRTYYLHGVSAAGEADIPDAVSGLWHIMDPNEPTEPAPKSQFVTNGYETPNYQCSGNSLLPVWKGELSTSGFKGDITVAINTVAPPAARMAVELFADASGGCTSDNPVSPSKAYVPPVAAEVVDVPAGPGVTEVTFKNVSFEAMANVTLQLHMEEGSPNQVRVFYDSPDFASSVTLKCKGKPCL